MKSSYIVKMIGDLAFLLVALAACTGKPGRGSHAGEHAVADGVHSGFAVDSGISHLLKPVNAQVVATIPAITADSGSRIYSAEAHGVITYDTRNQTSISSRVAGRIERLLVRYNYQPVKKGQLIMEVYSPDLAAAQQELIYVAHNSPDLLTGARQRLQLLGMQPIQIDHVLKTGEILYRSPVYSHSDGYILEKSAAASTAVPTRMPAATPMGDGMGGMGVASTPVATVPVAPSETPVLLREGQYVSAGQPLFTIYRNSNLVAEFAFPPQLAARLTKGHPLLFYPTSDPAALQPGHIGLIEPKFRNGENFTLARVYPDNTDFRVGQLLTAYIPMLYSEGWWLPRQAVWRLGNKAVVFKQEREMYVPVVVQIGAEVQGMVQVLTRIADWRVASNAAYLIDSESFIKVNEIQQR